MKAERFSEEPPLTKFSVVIPAQNEEGCVQSTVERLHQALASRPIPHEIIVVDDHSTDRTYAIVAELSERIPEVKLLTNTGAPGFGRAIIYGLDQITGDAAAIVMADESDDAGDLLRYWDVLNQGWHAVFGSRFIKGGDAIDYPWLKLWLNRAANLFIQTLFHISLNDTTNAFKAYRTTALNGCRPFLSAQFNLTVELPLKIIVRGYSWTIIPITWRNRRSGQSKLKIQEMGSRYLFIVLYCWLEKSLSRGDYRKN